MSAMEVKDWIGRSEMHADVAGLSPMRGLASLLDRDPGQVKLGDALPLGGHWLYFLPFARQSTISPDGHPQRGGFMPSVPLPRRMWAGGSLEYVGPIHLGDSIEKRSRIANVVEKTGRTGELVFVSVDHEIYGPNGLAIRERQEIVYRAPAPKIAEQATSAPEQGDILAFDHKAVFTPDPVKLFRFSALTFNAHRIHYDRDYARDEEGYEDLVVHGPLIATLLLDLARDMAGSTRLSSFSWSGRQPLFANAPFTLGAMREDDATLALAAVGPRGIATTASATIGP